MNEMHRVRELLSEPPPPSANATAEALLRLRNEIDRTPRRGYLPKLARRRPLGLASIATAAAVIAAIAIIAVGSRTATDPRSGDPNARTVLLSAAASAEKTAEGSGSYWMTYEQQGNVVVVGTAPHRYVLERRMRLKQWVGLGDRPSWQSTRELGAHPQRPADVAAWQQAGSPTRWANPAWKMRAEPWKTEKLPVKLSLAEGSIEKLRRLPDDPAGLRAHFLSRERSEGHISPTNWLYNCAVELLESQPAPAKVRAAAYRMLADLPAIRSLGPTTDPLGRRGVGLALGDNAPGGPTTENRLIIDPSTGRLLAEETVLLKPGGNGPNMDAPAGTILNYRALLTATWTNQAP
jgi:hypothetical protein